MESSLEEVFNAFMGGYWGPSYYFYINKVKDGYQFKYGYDKDGRIIDNTISGINLYESLHSKEYYDLFINKLLKLTRKWKKKYYDSPILDGMQWHIRFTQHNKEYAGSNNFPEDYQKVMDFVKEFFNVRPDVEKIKNGFPKVDDDGVIDLFPETGNDFPTVEYDFSTIEEYITKQLEEIGKMEEPNHEEKTKK